MATIDTMPNDDQPDTPRGSAARDLASSERAGAQSGGAAPLLGSPDPRELYGRTWWVFLIGGIAGIAFGVLAFLHPTAAWFVLASFFAAFVLVDGAFNIVGSLRNRERRGWWIMLLIGVLGVVVGAYALFNPPVSMLAFMLIVAVQAALLGTLLILLGWRVRAQTEREWILYLTGALSIAFGIFVVARPEVGSLSVIGLIAGWALATGILRIAFAFRARRCGGEARSPGVSGGAPRSDPRSNPT